MSYQLKPINEVRSFTEYQVRSSTSLFAIGFDYYEDLDNIHVRLNGTAIQDIGYTYELYNRQTLRITPAIQQGTLRISRETDIDQNKHMFSSGAIFNAANMDENFEQIRHRMQELWDELTYAMARLSVRDTILEIEASTSFPEPEMTFGLYVTAREIYIADYYPHIAYVKSDVNINIGVFRNDIQVGWVYADKDNSLWSTFNFTGGEARFIRGDRLSMKLSTYHYSLEEAAVTLVGRFPLYDIF